MQRQLAIGLALGLIALSGAAFATASLLKLRQPKVERIRLTPEPIIGRGWAFSPARGPAIATFMLHERGRTRASILDGRGHVVRELPIVRRGGTSATVTWDGRDANGRHSPDGIYHVRLRLPDRTITLTADPLSLDTRVALERVDVARVERSADPDRRRFTPRSATRLDGTRLAVNVRGGERLQDVAITFAPRDRGTPVVLRARRGSGAPPRRTRLMPFIWRASGVVPPATFDLRVTVHDLVGNARTVDAGAVIARVVLLTAPSGATRPGETVIVPVNADSSRFGIFLCRLGATRCDHSTSIDPNRGAPGRTRSEARFRLPRALRPGVYVAQADYHGAHPRVVVPVRASPAVGVALVTGAPLGELEPFARVLDERGTLYDALPPAQIEAGDGYRVIVVPPGTPLDAAARSVIASSGARIARSLAQVRR